MDAADRFINIDCPICDSIHFNAVTTRFDSGRIVRCSDCGHIYLNPTLTDAALSAIYKIYHNDTDEELHIKTVNGWFSDPHGPYQYVLNEVVREAGFKEKRVLDVGCSSGRFLHECRKRGAVTTGVDSSPAAERLAKKCFNLDIISKTVEDAVEEGDLSIGKFDMIFAFEVTEHVRKPAEFLKILYKLLAPGGRLYVSTPNFCLFDLMGKAAPDMRQCSEHIQFFTPSSLENCLRLSGYNVTDITTVGRLRYSDRKKQEFAVIPAIRNIWRLARRISPIYKIKNSLFGLLDKKKEAEEVESRSGTTLVAVAKPAERTE